MRVLVVGGAGYVGHVLVPTLVKRGHDVVVADWLLFDEWPEGSIENIQVDIREPTEGFTKALRDADCIVHLAAISNDPCSELDADLTWTTNVGGTLNVVRGCGCQRLIYASSSSVYGICEEKATENSPLKPLTRYSASKVWAERVVEPEIPDVVVVRPATLMGYSPRMRFDLMVNGFTGQAAEDGQIELWGGQQYRSLLHIQDMVNFYCTLVEWPGLIVHPEANIFNVSAVSMTTGEIAQLVSDCTGAEINLIEECRDNRSYQVRGDRAEEYFQWKPQYTVEDAIMEILEAIHESKTSQNDPRTINVKWMRKKGYGSSY